MKTPLDYDPRIMRSLRRRRRWNVVAVVVAALVAFGAIGFLKLRPVWPQVRTWWAYKQVEDFAFPVGQVVFDCRPDALAGVDFSDPEAAVLSFTYLSVRTGFSQQQLAAQAAVRIPAIWAALPLDRGKGGLIFAGARQTPAGHRFLVDVQAEDIGELAMTVRVIVPAGFDTPPRVFSQSALRVRVSDVQKLQIFAGQADPKVPSRFTINYSIDGKRGVIEGQLNDMGQLALVPDSGRIEHSDRIGDSWIVDP